MLGPEAVDEGNVAYGGLQVPEYFLNISVLLFAGQIQSRLPVGRLQLEHALRRLDGLRVVFRQDAYLEKGRDVPVFFEVREAALFSYQVVQDHANVLELLALRKLVARDHQKGRQVDARVLVWLDLEESNFV